MNNYVCLKVIFLEKFGKIKKSVKGVFSHLNLTVKIDGLLAFFEDRRPSTLSKIGEKLGLAPNFVRFGPDLISHFERGSWLVTIQPLKKVIVL